jgi:outer membrane receptor protein involved in Fe transport
MQEFNEACRNSGDPVCTVGGWYGGFWPRFYPELTEIDFDYKRTIEYEELAIYGELTYHFSDTFRLTGGLRWFDNETINNSHLGFPLVVGWTPTQFPESKDSDDDILVKLNASWDLSGGQMLYATYSEGYRHGGAQAVPSPGQPFGEPNAEAIRQFAADSVQNYEIGIKGLTDKLSYTISAFHVDWDDPQLNTTTAVFGFYIATNGDKASTQGIEAEVEGFIGENFHYRAGYTYVKAELDKDFISPQTGNVVAPSGARLPASPENVLSLSFDNTWNISSGMDLVLGVNSYYQSKSDNFISKTSTWHETFDDFWLIGGNVTLVADNWNAMLYIRNAGDEAGASGGFPEAEFGPDGGIFENWYGNANRQFIVQPRTVGLKFTYEFGN